MVSSGYVLDAPTALPMAISRGSIHRTELIGEKRLPPGNHPRERTLRKLTWYTARDPQEIVDYVADLKKRNHTLAWRKPGNPNDAD